MSSIVISYVPVCFQVLTPSVNCWNSEQRSVCVGQDDFAVNYVSRVWKLILCYFSQIEIKKIPNLKHLKFWTIGVGTLRRRVSLEIETSEALKK